MFRKAKTYLFLAVFLLAASCVLAVAVFIRTILPPYPAKPYFLERSSRISGTNIHFGEFQPVYLWAFEKDGGYFYKVAYRAPAGKIVASVGLRAAPLRV